MSEAAALRDGLAARWQALAGPLGLPAGLRARWQAEGRALVRSWARWPRAYHDLHHLAACLRHFDTVRERLRDPLAGELALWFHDAVYWPWSSRNEAASADWAARLLGALPVRADLADAVVRHVMDTRHASPPARGDAQWIIDIDLAILGQPDAVYRQFERNVRSEYRFIPWRRYTARRLRVLGSFAAREHIYETPWFRERLEAQARANLQHAMQALARGELYGPLAA